MKKALWVAVAIATIGALIASPVLYKAESPPSETYRAPVTVPTPHVPLEPVKGLRFGMSWEAAVAALPELATAPRAVPEPVHELVDVVGIATMSRDFDREPIAGRATRPVEMAMPGITFEVTTTLGDFPTKCRITFEGEERPRSLAAFLCRLDRQAYSDPKVVAQGFFDAWHARFGVPVLNHTPFGDRPDDTTFSGGHEARWSDASASLTLTVTLEYVIRLQGATAAYEGTVRKLLDAGKRTKGAQEEDEKRALERRLENVRKDF